MPAAQLFSARLAARLLRSCSRSTTMERPGGWPGARESPAEGFRAGAFRAPEGAAAYRFQDGRIGAPIRGNTLRITGNVRQLLQNSLGITKEARPVVGWAADEVVYAPEVAVRELHLTEIAQF